jgi:hypothetical protein
VLNDEVTVHAARILARCKFPGDGPPARSPHGTATWHLFTIHLPSREERLLRYKRAASRIYSSPLSNDRRSARRRGRKHGSDARYSCGLTPARSFRRIDGDDARPQVAARAERQCRPEI